MTFRAQLFRSREVEIYFSAELSSNTHIYLDPKDLGCVWLELQLGCVQNRKIAIILSTKKTTSGLILTRDGMILKVLIGNPKISILS